MNNADNLSELERAQIILQLVMTKFSCDEAKAKEIIGNMNINAPAVEMVSAPAFKKHRNSTNH